MGLSHFFSCKKCLRCAFFNLLGMVSGGYIDKLHGIDVVIYHIFSHEIDWLSRLDVLLKKSPKM